MGVYGGGRARAGAGAALGGDARPRNDEIGFQQDTERSDRGLATPVVDARAFAVSKRTGARNKLDAISMPDNGRNCPIKTRNDVPAPRSAAPARDTLSRT
ncbi:hypothetical protein EVAR_88696_1 [Eumeta japonica]|uniref:Uncharacterized protein n=1 Tax=Eumeta variegata TaxID=151549 RepID=A0A4C1Y4Z4_EUMVA|nr:hypothetical protein EVAR_88696_1 [Eumeta japonica]